MKKIFVLFLFGFLALGALLVNMSCNTAAPSAAGFQSPLQTLVAINPSPTSTATSTPTLSPTITPTSTPTNTPTATPTPTPTPTP